MANANKRFQHKIYDINGNFLTEWADVINDPEFDKEINSGLKEMVLRLARPFKSFGFGSDVFFENEIRTFCYDREAPQGVQIFSGRLNEIRPSVIAGSEFVDVQFLGYGSQLGDRYARDRTSDNVVDVQVGYTLQSSFGAQAFQTDSITTNNAEASIFFPTANNVTGFRVPITPTAANATCQVALATADYNQSLTNTGFGAQYTPGVIIDVITLDLSALPLNIEATVTALFSKTIPTNPASPYFYVITGNNINVTRQPTSGPTTADINTTNPAAQYMTLTSPTMAKADLLPASNFGTTIVGAYKTSLKFSTLFDSLAPVYASTDVCTIATDLLTNKYSGKVTADPAMGLAGWNVSYVFNKMKMSQAIAKCVDLAPPFFYSYINALNVLSLKRRQDDIVDHVLSIGVEISEIQPILSVNAQKTREIFLGGAGQGTTELLFVDDRDNLQTLYGLKEDLLQDQRVLQGTTAALFTHSALDDVQYPATTFTIKVNDSNGDGQNGYDIEKIEPGQMIQIIDPQANGKNQTTGTWQDAVWDETSFEDADFNMFSQPYQVQRVHYTPDFALVTLSFDQADSPNRIQDIESNAVQYQQGQTSFA